MDIDFSPEKSLFSLPVVQWCAGVSAAIASAVTLTIIFNLRHLPFDFSASGFNYFADLYKVPAALLAIGFTLVGLCAANHRSEQTKKQIERTANQIELTNDQINLTKVQNNFSNYYKHIEEFEKYCGDNNDYKTYIPEPRKLHRLIFPKANSATAFFLINEELIKNLDDFILKIDELSKRLDSDDLNDRFDSAYTIKKVMADFRLSTFIRIYYDSNGIQVNTKQGMFHLPEKSWRTFFSYFKLHIQVLDTVMRFNLSYESSKIVKAALLLNLEKLPGDGGISERFRLNIGELIKNETGND